MTARVDLQNPEVIEHIKWSKLLPPDHNSSPRRYIPLDQQQLIDMARAYEAGDTLVPDRIYDMMVRYLQRQQLMFPLIWDTVSLPQFEDNAWTYTGSFYH